MLIFFSRNLYFRDNIHLPYNVTKRLALIFSLEFHKPHKAAITRIQIGLTLKSFQLSHSICRSTSHIIQEIRILIRLLKIPEIAN